MLQLLALGIASILPPQGYESGFGGDPPPRGDSVPPVCADVVPPPAPEAAPKPERFGDLGPRTAPTKSSPAGLTPAGPPESGTEDVQSWVRWWRYNGPAQIASRRDYGPARVHRGGDQFFLGRGQSSVTPPVERPTAASVRAEVAPALLGALAEGAPAEVASASLMALAKIGSPRAGRMLLPVLLRHLDRELAVAESAALAVGILGEAAGADALLGLALDRPTGRALCGRSTVPLRMRTFALYGLGLIAEACPDPALQVRIADALLTLLESGGEARPDLSAAAVTALGLTRLPWQSPGGPARTDRGEVVSRLHRLLAGDRRGKGALRHDAARAQVPVALARLLKDARRATGPLASAHLAETVNLMLARGHRRSPERSEAVRQAMVIALGQLSTSGGAGDPAADRNLRVQRLLTSIAEGSAHELSESFALVALARQAGTPGSGPAPHARLRDAEASLLRQLARGTSRKRAWAALSLGVLGAGARGGGADLLPSTVEALERTLDGAGNPDLTGAAAVALGLLGDVGAERLLLEKFEAVSEGRARGHVAIGLGLLGAAAATGPLLTALQEDRHQPQLAEQLGVAIGLVADRRQMERLAKLLEAEIGRSSGLPLALPVGRAGHPTGVPGLVALLGAPSGVQAARAQAAAALGIACDKDEVPWSARLGVDVHYGVEIETLVNSERTGILDAY